MLRRRDRFALAGSVAGAGLAVSTALSLLACAAGQEAAPSGSVACRAVAAQPAAGQPRTAAGSAEQQTVLSSGLIGSKHDFSGTGGPLRELCLPCHSARIAATAPVLLDRHPATTQPVRPYDAVAVELNGASLVCLSCHDGVVAADIYSGAHATVLSDQLASLRPGSAELLSHPVGVRYPAELGRFNASAVVQGVGLKLPEGRIQCTTCHDPHNRGRHERMLRISNARGRLCLSCHRL